MSIIHIASAEDTTVQSWYLKYGNPGEAPKTPDNGAYTEKYGVLSLDKTGNKNIYLTFDAGYENGNIEKILDTLKKHDVKSAFFVLPNLIKSNTELVRRMYNEGHLICNHTKSHGNIGKVTDIAELQRELEGNEAILKEYLGLDMAKYYRPPEGAYSELNLMQANRLGYKTVFWSIAYADWDNNKQQSYDKALNLLLSRVHPGCIVLLHPTSSTNAAIMDDFITNVKQQGYCFKTLDEFPLNIESNKAENQ